MADLPTSRGRAYLRGVGLPEGRFIVTGEEEFLNVFIISDISNICNIFAGGKCSENEEGEGDSSEILMFDGNEKKWTKAEDLCTARYMHAVALVPEDIVDHCIFDIEC